MCKISEEMQQKWKEQGYDNQQLILYIPDESVLVCAGFGTGDNLLKEDRENGFNDYVNYMIYDWSEDCLEELDGGMLLFCNETTDYYHDLKLLADDLAKEAEYDTYDVIAIH